MARAVTIGLWCYLLAVPVRLQFGTPYLIGTDSPFHARYASEFTWRAFSRTFPVTAYSIWNRQWGDKEFLFHAYLAPFCQSERYLGPGAKLAAAILFAAVLCSLAYILRRQRVSGSLAWAALLPALSVGWDFRMLMVRSHVASVLLILWILYCFERRRIRPLVILTFVYTWTYTAPYFALLLCCFMAAGRWMLGILRDNSPAAVPDDPHALESKPTRRHAPDRMLLLACVVATVAGLIIHPQTPNQILNDWLHLSRVTLRAWGVANAPAELGSEFQSETLREAYSLHPGVVACLAVAWLLAAVAPGARSRRTLLFLWMTLPVAGLYGLSGRFIEYLAPLALWALALVVNDVRTDLGPLRMRMSRRTLAVAMASFILLVAGLHLFTLRQIDRLIWHPETRVTEELAGRWLAQHAAPGDLVVPLDWTQFPSLYYFAPKLRYPFGLEPTTMEVVYPDKLHYLEQVRLGQRDLDMNELQRVFPDARYVVLWKASGLAAARILPKKFVPVFAEPDAVIYDVHNYRRSGS